jgi:hypothetical protein
MEDVIVSHVWLEAAVQFTDESAITCTELLVPFDDALAVFGLSCIWE